MYDIDRQNELFWTDNSMKVIGRSNLNGSNAIFLVNSDLSGNSAACMMDNGYTVTISRILLS